MTHFRGLALALALVAVSGVGSASAQGLDGFYLGGHLGSARATGGYDAFTPWNGYAGFDVQDLDGSSIAAGVQAGRNWDRGNFVIGVEASLSAVSISETSTSSVLRGTVPPFSRSVNNLFTLMPRIGVKVGNGMIYAKGGVAMAGIGSEHDQNGTLIAGSSTETGLALGIGAEFPVSDRLTMRIDYTQADFGTVRTDLAGSPDIWTEQDVKAQMVSLGFNYYLP